MTKLVGWDIDGVLSTLNDGFKLEEGAIIISGRTWAEYDQLAKSLAAQVPVYIRGIGAYGDSIQAGQFKAAIISMLGVTTFHEDDPKQIAIINHFCPDVEIIQH